MKAIVSSMEQWRGERKGALQRKHRPGAPSNRSSHMPVRRETRGLLCARNPCPALPEPSTPTKHLFPHAWLQHSCLLSLADSVTPEAGIQGSVPLTPCPRCHLDSRLGRGPHLLAVEERLLLITFTRFLPPVPKLPWACQLPPSILIKLLTVRLCARTICFLSPPETHGIILPPSLALVPRAKSKAWGSGGLK